MIGVATMVPSSIVAVRGAGRSERIQDFNTIAVIDPIDLHSHTSIVMIRLWTLRSVLIVP